MAAPGRSLGSAGLPTPDSEEAVIAWPPPYGADLRRHSLSQDTVPDQQAAIWMLAHRALKLFSQAASGRSQRVAGLHADRPSYEPSKVAMGFTMMPLEELTKKLFGLLS